MGLLYLVQAEGSVQSIPQSDLLLPWFIWSQCLYEESSLHVCNCCDLSPVVNGVFRSQKHISEASVWLLKFFCSKTCYVTKVSVLSPADTPSSTFLLPSKSGPQPGKMRQNGDNYKLLLNSVQLHLVVWWDAVNSREKIIKVLYGRWS